MKKTDLSKVDRTTKTYINSYFQILAENMKLKLKLKLIFFIAASFACAFNLSGQTVVACNANRNICPQPAFQFTNNTNNKGLLIGLGVSNPIFNPQVTMPQNAGCMFGEAVNPEWMVINISSTGNLGFVLGASTSANPQSSFLHWILWRYTPATCTNIFNNTLPPLACNFNGFPNGGTGMGPLPLGGQAGNFQPSIPVVQGEQYLLLVSNTSSVVTNISFSGNGSAGLTCNPLTVPNLTACPGQTVVNTASWAGVSNTNYTVLPPGGGIPIFQPSPDFTVSALATGVFTVFATGFNAVLNQSISATNGFTVSINPTSVLSIAHATNFCYGSCADFSLSPAQGTFVASGPGVAPTAPSSNSVISICNLQSPNNNGVFTFSASFATGCVGTTTAQVNIAPNNFITVQSAFAPNTNTIDVCLNTNAPFFANMTTATSYTLTGPCLAAPIVTPAVGGTGNFVLGNIQVPCAGTYAIAANINFNGIQCLRTETLLVRVVITNPVIAQSSYTFCEGTQACLTASAAGTTSNSFAWQGPLGFQSFAQNPCITGSITTAPNPNMAGNYIVFASFSNGFATCATNTVINVQVVPVPQLFIAMPSPVCQYQYQSMCISPSASSYRWTGPAGFTSTNQCSAIPNIQPLNAGTYTGSVIFSIGTRTCYAQTTANLNVIPVDNVTITATPFVCRPDNINLAADALSATSYVWAGPNSFTSNVRTPIIYYPPVAASGVYTVYVTFNNGFPCANSNTISVSVNPVLTFSVQDFYRACPGESVTINGPAGATSYTWSGSSGFNSNNMDLTIPSISPAQGGFYNISVNLGPCVSTRQLEIQVLSPITFTLPPLSREICKNETSLFEVGATGGSEVYAYNWFPSNYLNSPTGNVVTGKVLGTTLFNVTAYDVACPNYTISYPFTVVVDQPPVPDLRLVKTEACYPEPFEFNTRTNNMKNGGITTFFFGDYEKRQGDSIPNYIFRPGTHILKIVTVAKFGDRSCADTYEHPAPFVIHPRAEPIITWSPEVPNTTDNIVTFNATSNNSTIKDYNWMFAGTNSGNIQDSSDLVNPRRTYEETGKFPILLIATTEFGCIDTTITFLEIKDDMNVFIPNSFTPNNDGINDVFQVKGIGFKSESFFIEIFDRWGRSVYTSKDVTKGWDGTIKGQNSAEGLYIYRVRIIGANGEGRKEYMGNVTLLK